MPWKANKVASGQSPSLLTYALSSRLMRSMCTSKWSALVRTIKSTKTKCQGVSPQYLLTFCQYRDNVENFVQWLLPFGRVVPWKWAGETSVSKECWKAKNIFWANHLITEVDSLSTSMRLARNFALQNFQILFFLFLLFYFNCYFSIPQLQRFLLKSTINVNF